MPKVITFQEAIEATKNKDRPLLIGNGFSSRYFSYRSLLEKTDLQAGEPLRRLFDSFGTVDFEAVIRALEEAARVEVAYEHSDQADQFRADADRLREQLVHAIRTIHPAHREDIEGAFPSSRAFLKNFSTYFTLNYDLLLYWIQLNTKDYNDGFGLGSEAGGFRGPFKSEAYCNTYNLHGGLHLFMDDVGDVQKRVMGQSGIIDAIAETITEQKLLPLYVAEGTWQAKLAKINSIAYLRYGLDRLRNCSGNIFIFGHSAHDTDTHIYTALFSSNIEHLYFGLYKPNDDSVRSYDAQLSRFQKLSKKNIQYSFYDAQSANVWDAAP